MCTLSELLPLDRCKDSLDLCMASLDWFTSSNKPCKSTILLLRSNQLILPVFFIVDFGGLLLGGTGGGTGLWRLLVVFILPH